MITKRGISRIAHGAEDYTAFRKAMWEAQGSTPVTPADMKRMCFVPKIHLFYKDVYYAKDRADAMAIMSALVSFKQVLTVDYRSNHADFSMYVEFKSTTEHNLSGQLVDDRPKYKGR